MDELVCRVSKSIISLIEPTSYAMENPHRNIQLVHPGMIDTPPVRQEYDNSVVAPNSISPLDLARAILASKDFYVRVPAFTSFCGALMWTVIPNWSRWLIPRLLPKTKAERFIK